MKRVAAALLLVLLAACNSSTTATTPRPAPTVRVIEGGCAGTVLSYDEPPEWAQGGWTHTKGTPWSVPWAIGTGANAVAYLFAVQLVAGTSPRSNGTANKVLWVVKDAAVSNFLVRGHPLGGSAPVVEVAGGPSIVDAPTSGCWTFELSWTAGAATTHTSAINLDVLPEGSLPG